MCMEDGIILTQLQGRETEGFACGRMRSLEDIRLITHLDSITSFIQRGLKREFRNFYVYRGNGDDISTPYNYCTIEFVIINFNDK